MECSICGISGSKTRLLDALSREGIVKICEPCSVKERMPIVRRPTTFQLKKAEQRVSYRQRIPGRIDRSELNKAEVNLREIVDRNYQKSVSQERLPRPDLVDNFHWVIMRARRAKKLTQAQMARDISESEAAITMAEKGILPEDDYRLIRKIESFLGVGLIKENVKKTLSSREPARILRVDPKAMDNLKIADLQRMKQAKESVETFGMEDESLDDDLILEPEDSEVEDFK